MPHFIAGRFEVIRTLGTGAIGIVYLCRDRLNFDRHVVAKVLFAELCQDEAVCARLRNEFVSGCSILHPNVLRPIEYVHSKDLIILVTEYADGGDLSDWIARGGAAHIESAINIIAQILDGIQAIHDGGIIHRDLKPENILFTSEGVPKITDFGIARTAVGPRLTEHGDAVGTVDYISPEYLERGQIDARADIYALGILAFEIIGGESPFRGKSVIETMTMRLQQDPPSLLKLRPDCPILLEQIVRRALARDPDARFQTARDMVNELRPIAAVQ